MRQNEELLAKFDRCLTKLYTRTHICAYMHIYMWIEREKDHWELGKAT